MERWRLTYSYGIAGNGEDERNIGAQVACGGGGSEVEGNLALIACGAIL